ncbi:unnamed protein product [Medioppia subpectinata]|uniref:Uncharacterized protein n=1 Tax=Medioppia subpectinata TaxID=1979941 RepID=A0A7R9LTD3_9ACAR|nr:unnamed protein product [Medioppia subpectinata]CAG2121556.1 unnamed protein product [Medioppia subpectinata]
MRFLLSLSVFIVCALFSVSAQKPKNATTIATTTQTSNTTADDKPPTINWGKCPQLEPKDSEKRAKQAVLETCLQKHPIPANLTQQSIESHQKAIAECALRAEKWFTKAGNYRFSKAETEIRAKKLQKPIESQLLANHKNCESEAKREFPKTQIIEQIQLYQACVRHVT